MSTMEYPIDAKKPWYHGSNLMLTELRTGSTITQWRALAEAFSTKPTMLGYDTFDSPIFHNGTEKGYLYVIDEPVAVGEGVYQHPRTTMDPGVEFLTERRLKLRLIKDNEATF